MELSKSFGNMDSIAAVEGKFVDKKRGFDKIDSQKIVGGMEKDRIVEEKIGCH